jgi:hypothetical protein
MLCVGRRVLSGRSFVAALSLSSSVLIGARFLISPSAPASSMTELQNFTHDIFATKRGGVDVRGAVWQIPHDQKRAKGGEDTYVLTSDVTFPH